MPLARLPVRPLHGAGPTGLLRLRAALRAGHKGQPDVSTGPVKRTPGSRLLRAALALLLTAGCQQSPEPGTKPLVVASVFPLYEFARQVAGDRAKVVSLVPSGVEPHDWEPSPQDIAQVRRARLFVYNGAGFEPWALKLQADLAGKATTVISATAGLPLQTGDPHVWLDPVLAQSQVETIRAALALADPSGAAVYADNAREFSAKLAGLNDRFEAGLRDCARRE